MLEFGFGVLLGLIVGLLVAAWLSNCLDRDVEKRRIFKVDDRLYRLIPID